MKKIISLFLILVLALSVFTLTGCGNQNNAGSTADKTNPSSKAATDTAATIVGTWETELDLSDSIRSQFTSQLPENASSLADLLTLQEFNLKMTLNLKEDGTYAQSADESSLDASFEGMKKDLRSALNAYFQSQIDAQGVNMTVDEMLAASGRSMDDLMAQVDESLDASVIADTFNKEGTYKAEDGKLWLSDSPDAEIDETQWDNYTLDGDTLTLTEGNANTADDSADDSSADSALTETFQDLFPIVFHRVENGSSSS